MHNRNKGKIQQNITTTNINDNAVINQHDVTNLGFAIKTLYLQHTSKYFCYISLR